MRKVVFFAVELGILSVFCRSLLADFWAARISGWLYETLFYVLPGLVAFGLFRWLMLKRREYYSLPQAVAAVVSAPLCAWFFSALPGFFSGASHPFFLLSAAAVLADIALLTAALALATLSLRGGAGRSQRF